MKELSKSIADLRVDYSLKKFDEADLIKNPMEQFEVWLDEAIKTNVNEPNAMTLATVKPDGSPSARVVLLKGVSDSGFVFFTNYESNKGQEILQNPKVCLVFCWLELQRQVRIEGEAVKVSAADSDQYFMTRPTGSQIGAHASPQSKPVVSREELERMFAEFEELFSKEPIMRPKHWGGFRVVPQSIEFWQGRQNRLHDRFLFRKVNNSWDYSRLAP